MTYKQHESLRRDESDVEALVALAVSLRRSDVISPNEPARGGALPTATLPTTTLLVMEAVARAGTIPEAQVIYVNRPALRQRGCRLRTRLLQEIFVISQLNHEHRLAQNEQETLRAEITTRTRYIMLIVADFNLAVAEYDESDLYKDPEFVQILMRVVQSKFELIEKGD
jgi:hypothetical protein